MGTRKRLWFFVWFDCECTTFCSVWGKLWSIESGIKKLLWLFLFKNCFPDYDYFYLRLFSLLGDKSVIVYVIRIRFPVPCTVCLAGHQIIEIYGIETLMWTTSILGDIAPKLLLWFVLRTLTASAFFNPESSCSDSDISHETKSGGVNGNIVRTTCSGDIIGIWFLKTENTPLLQLPVAGSHVPRYSEYKEKPLRQWRCWWWCTFWISEYGRSEYRRTRNRRCYCY